MTFEFDIGKPVIVLGAGGHARVIIDALQLCGREIIGLTDVNGDVGSEIMGVKVLGDDDSILKYSPAEVELVNGIGTLPGIGLRRELHMRMNAKGYLFGRVIHPSAVVSAAVELDQGAQIMAGVVIQAGAKIGSSCIINTGAIVDHDCVIEAHSHLAPGVTVSGNVIIKENTHIGTGASIIQGISIGSNCVIAAGATVYKDLADGTRYVPEHETAGSTERGKEC